MSFEGAQKVLAKLHLYPEHSQHDAATRATTSAEIEKSIVSSAVRTDLILSAEIMLISLANITAQSNMVRVAIMVCVAFFMTFFVYGLVAILVKMDDLGLHMTSRGGWLARTGKALVAIMPKVFTVIGVVGTVAMLWVGGHIVIASLSDLGFSALHHVVEDAQHLVSGAGGGATWSVETALSGIFGFALGAAIAYLWLGVSALLPSKNA